MAAAYPDRSQFFASPFNERDNPTRRLVQLSEEFGEIAAQLMALQLPSDAQQSEDGAAEAPAISGRHLPAKTVRRLIMARRWRAKHLPADLFADPAWDILLDLLHAELLQQRVPVSSLCAAADVPPTTALRWIKVMVDRGLLIRRADPCDGRRCFIELSQDTSAAMRNYFDDLETAP